MGVVHHTNAAGDVSIGVEVEGAYVPIVGMSAAKIAQHVERYNNLTERAHEGDGAALALLGSSYQAPSTGPEDLGELTKAQLREVAESEGVEGLTSSSTRGEIIDAIESHRDEGEDD